MSDKRVAKCAADKLYRRPRVSISIRPRITLYNDGHRHENVIVIGLTALVRCCSEKNASAIDCRELELKSVLLYASPIKNSSSF